MRLKFDPSRCTGCCACQMACLDQRDIAPGLGEAPLCRIAQTEQDGRITQQFVHCIHCGACIPVCPTGALHRDAHGLVQLLTDACAGCHSCQDVCSLISFDAKTGRGRKCDGCIGRVTAGLLPACVHTCPTGALTMEA